jgi:hypothetical protein
MSFVEVNIRGGNPSILSLQHSANPIKLTAEGFLNFFFRSGKVMALTHSEDDYRKAKDVVWNDLDQLL